MEGCFLKGAFWRAIHVANLAVALILEDWTQLGPAIWFFNVETNTFWSCFQYLLDFWRILMDYIVWGLTISFRGFITSKLTRIFINFRVIHVLLSLILFYWIMLDQTSHTWFEWNLVNGCTAWNCHPICMQLVECRLCLKTYLENEKKKNLVVRAG